MALSLSRVAQAGSRAAAALEPAPRVRATGITTVGSVAQAPGFKGGTGFVSSFSTTFANASGGTLNYVLGDQLGLINAVAGGGVPYTQPSSASTTVSALQNSFGMLPVTIIGMIYSSTSGAVQFAQNFKYGQADVDGSALLKAVRMGEYQRPTNFNANQLAIEFVEQYRLDANSGFVVTVPTGQTVDITWLIGAAAYRT